MLEPGGASLKRVIAQPIDPIDAETALIVIDLKKDIVSPPAVHPMEGVVKQVIALADAHHNSVTRIFPRIGETGTSQEVIGLLERRV